MEKKSLLGWLVVIGVHKKYSIYSCVLGMLAKPDCFVSCIGACSCNYRDPALGELDGLGYDSVILLMGEGW